MGWYAVRRAVETAFGLCVGLSLAMLFLVAMLIASGGKGFDDPHRGKKHL